MALKHLVMFDVCRPRTQRVDVRAPSCYVLSGMAKSEYLHMRIDEDLKAAIRREARRRHIDASALVSLVLGEWIARNGKKPVELSSVDPDGNQNPSGDVDH